MNYLTAGESHGPQLTGIIEGLPAGLLLDIDAINDQLAARQGGYGRGSRQKLNTISDHCWWCSPQEDHGLTNCASS